MLVPVLEAQKSSKDAQGIAGEGCEPQGRAGLGWLDAECPGSGIKPRPGGFMGVADPISAEPHARTLLGTKLWLPIATPHPGCKAGDKRWLPEP